MNDFTRNDKVDTLKRKLVQEIEPKIYYIKVIIVISK